MGSCGAPGAHGETGETAERQVELLEPEKYQHVLVVALVSSLGWARAMSFRFPSVHDRQSGKNRLGLYALVCFYHRGMVDEARLEPIDGKAWSEYNRTGRSHFDGVQRSWRIFWRNASELVNLLHSVETDPVSSLSLMQDTGTGDEELDRFHREFWDALDQRLHNLVSSAVSLVDHTRPLVEFYEHEPTFQDEFRVKNEDVARSPRASFLRRLRNYLLHYGVAPLMQTMRLEATSAEQWDHLRIRLSANGLLVWSGWKQEQREFLESFDGGPPLRDICVGYVEDMRALYSWLFAQHSTLHAAGVPPRHLTERRADWIQF